MPRYVFTVTKNGRASKDLEGLSFDDMAGAWEEATKACGELLRDVDGSLEVGTEWSVSIQDEKGRPLRTITIATESHNDE